MQLGYVLSPHAPNSSSNSSVLLSGFQGTLYLSPLNSIFGVCKKCKLGSFVAVLEENIKILRFYALYVRVIVSSFCNIFLAQSTLD